MKPVHVIGGVNVPGSRLRVIQRMISGESLQVFLRVLIELIPRSSHVRKLGFTVFRRYDQCREHAGFRSKGHVGTVRVPALVSFQETVAFVFWVG